MTSYESFLAYIVKWKKSKCIYKVSFQVRKKYLYDNIHVCKKERKKNKYMGEK